MSDMTKTQYSLAVKAAHNKQHRFGHLYRLICREEWITQAVEIILSNKGSRTAGIDDITKEHLASETARFELIQEIQQDYLVCHPVRESAHLTLLQISTPDICRTWPVSPHLQDLQEELQTPLSKSHRSSTSQIIPQV